MPRQCPFSYAPDPPTSPPRPCSSLISPAPAMWAAQCTHPYSYATCGKVFGKVVVVEPRVLSGPGQLAYIHDGCHTGSLDHFNEVLELEVGVAHGENAHVANATRQAGTPTSASGYRASAGGRTGRTGGVAGRTFNAFAPAFARHQSYLRPSVSHGPFG